MGWVSDKNKVRVGKMSEGLDKSRGCLQALRHLRKRELQKGTQPGSHSPGAPAVPTTQGLTEQHRGLQSHLLTEGCRTSDCFFPLICRFVPILSVQLRGFSLCTPWAVRLVQSGSRTQLNAGIVLLCQPENCFALLSKKCLNIAPSLDTRLWCKTKEAVKIILKCLWKLGDRPFPPQTGALLKNYETLK